MIKTMETTLSQEGINMFSINVVVGNDTNDEEGRGTTSSILPSISRMEITMLRERYDIIVLYYSTSSSDNITTFNFLSSRRYVTGIMASAVRLKNSKRKDHHQITTTITAIIITVYIAAVPTATIICNTSDAS